MDGVLVEAKEWHYEALNEALDLFGMKIDFDAHLSTFDGLSTKQKLKILGKSKGLPERLFYFLNQLKQKNTQKIIHQKCRPLFQHQYALSQLKRGGMKMAVCSNSVSKTVELMMQLTKLEEYMSFRLSNEDVANAKPAPDIYNLAMEKFNVAPSETLILEDNDHGIQAARSSGAHVMEIGTVNDVRYDRIIEKIKKING